METCMIRDAIVKSDAPVALRDRIVDFMLNTHERYREDVKKVYTALSAWLRENLGSEWECCVVVTAVIFHTSIKGTEVNVQTPNNSLTMAAYVPYHARIEKIIYWGTPEFSIMNAPPSQSTREQQDLGLSCVQQCVGDFKAGKIHDIDIPGSISRAMALRAGGSWGIVISTSLMHSTVFGRIVIVVSVGSIVFVISQQ